MRVKKRVFWLACVVLNLCCLLVNLCVCMNRLEAMFEFSGMQTFTNVSGLNTFYISSHLLIRF